MLSLSQAINRRGASGTPLPVVYQSFEAAGMVFRRGQLSVIYGPASAGKSLLAFNLLVGMRVPTLALVIDGDELSNIARFAAIVTGDDHLEIQNNIDAYAKRLTDEADYIRVVFSADTPEDIQLQLDAYEQRFGLPPDVLLVDTMGNLSSEYENEGQILKALCSRLEKIAKREQVAAIATHHATDIETTMPLPRSKMLFKVAQFPRMILSCAYDPERQEFRVAGVKLSSGQSDPAAQHPITLYANPSKMSLSEHPQVRASYQPRPDYYKIREQEREEVEESRPAGWGGFGVS